MERTTPDLIFSYWIFTWFIIYYFFKIPYNPLIALYIGLFFNSLQFSQFLYYGNYYKSFLFLIANVFLKIIPICLISHTKINKRDIYALIALFGIYLIYIYFIDFSLKKAIQYSNFNVKNKKIFTPLMSTIDKILQKFVKLNVF